MAKRKKQESRLQKLRQKLKRNPEVIPGDDFDYVGELWRNIKLIFYFFLFGWVVGLVFKGATPVPVVMAFAGVIFVMFRNNPEDIFLVFFGSTFLWQTFTGNFVAYNFADYQYMKAYTHASNAMGYAALGTFIFNRKKFTGLPYNPRFKRFNLMIVYFLFTIVFTSMTAQYPSTSFAEFPRIVQFIILYVLTIRIVNREYMYKRFVTMILALFLLQTIIAMYKMGINEKYSGAFYIFYYMPFAIGFTQYVFETPSLKKYRPFMAIMMLFGTIAPTIQASRRTFIAMLMYWVQYFARIKFKVQYVVFAVLILYIGYPLLPEVLTDRLDPTIETVQDLFTEGEVTASQQESFFNARDHLWEAGFDMFANHPILGVGLKNSNILMHTVYGWDHEARLHNLYLQFAADTGILGFTAFLMLMIFVLRNAMISGQAFKMQGNNFMKIQANSLRDLIITILIIAFFGYGGPLIKYDWVWYGMSISLHNVVMEKNWEQVRKHREDVASRRAKRMKLKPIPGRVR